MTSDESRGINDPRYLSPASTSHPDMVLKGPPAAQLTSSPLRGRRRTGGGTYRGTSDVLAPSLAVLGGRPDALDYLRRRRWTPTSEDPAQHCVGSSLPEGLQQ